MRLLTNILKGYYKICRGFNRQAATAVILSFVAAVIESVALFSLVPILKQLDNVGEVVAPRIAELPWIYWLENFSPNPTTRLLICLGTFFVFQTVSLLILLYKDWYIHRFNALFRIELQKRASKSLIDMDWLHLKDIQVGDANKGIVTESNFISLGVLGLVRAMSDLSMLLCFVVVGAFISWQCVLLLATCGVAYTILQRPLLKKVRRSSERISEQDANVQELSLSTLQGMKYWRVSGSIGELRSRLWGEIQGYANAVFEFRFLEALASCLFQILGAGIIIATVLVCTLVLGQGMSQAVLLLSITRRFMPLGRRLQTCILSGVTHYPWVDSWNKRYAHALSKPEPTFGAQKIQFQRKLEFKSVGMKYQTEESAAVALDQVNFELKKGQFVVAVGGSGAGKSTLIDLISGVIQPTSGSILVDEIPLEKLDIKSWRGQLGMMLQENPLLLGTVEENIILPEKKVDVARLKKALKGSRSEEFVESLALGLKTKVGSLGSSMSGGQRQRLMLARTLYAQRPILLLDEVTSNLDPSVEQLVAETLSCLKGKVTIFLVTHSLSLAKSADTILVFDQGRLVQSGSWESLCAKKSGAFYRLLRDQGFSTETAA